MLRLFEAILSDAAIRRDPEHQALISLAKATTRNMFARCAAPRCGVLSALRCAALFCLSISIPLLPAFVRLPAPTVSSSFQSDPPFPRPSSLPPTPPRSMFPDLTELRQRAGALEANLESRFDAAHGLYLLVPLFLLPLCRALRWRA